MEKLSQEELNLIQEFKSKTDQMVFEVGGLEYRKQVLLKAIEKEESDFKTVFDEFSKKYGDCTIDINTGEITKKENGENKDL
jgi:hypothetical protein